MEALYLLGGMLTHQMIFFAAIKWVFTQNWKYPFFTGVILVCSLI